MTQAGAPRRKPLPLQVGDTRGQAGLNCQAEEGRYANREGKSNYNQFLPPPARNHSRPGLDGHGPSVSLQLPDKGRGQLSLLHLEHRPPPKKETPGAET